MRKLCVLLVYVLASIILMASLPSSVRATTLVNADANGNRGSITGLNAGHHYPVNLCPIPARYVGIISSSSLMELVGEYPDWNFTCYEGLAPGQFRVIHYDAELDNPAGTFFQVDYCETAPNFPPTGEVLRWIQCIYTNRPRLTGLHKPYIDPQLNDDVGAPLPFYYSDQEIVNNLYQGRQILNIAPNVSIRFYDSPSRRLSQSPVNWLAELNLVSWDQRTPGNVTIYEGIEWGFEIRCYFLGAGNNIWGGVGSDKYPQEKDGVDGTDPKYCEHDYGWEAVGGIWIPVDKFDLLAPYIGLASTIVVATATTAIYVKRVKRRREK